MSDALVGEVVAEDTRSGAEINQIVSEVEKGLIELRKRQDADKLAYRLDEFKLKKKDKSEITNAHNVTLNDPAVFAKRVQAKLTKAKQQIIVTGTLGEREIGDDETNFFEKYVNEVRRLADRKLRRRQKAPLRKATAEQITVRGWVAARVYIQGSGADFDPDISWWDARYVSFKVGGDGLDWAAYRLKRKQSDVQGEYADELTAKGITVTSNPEILEFIDKVNIIIIMDGVHILRKTAHNFGEVPVVIVPAETGGSLLDEDATKFEGESCFSEVRDIYIKQNELATVVHSLSRRALNPPAQYKSKSGLVQPEKPIYEENSVTSVQVDEGFDHMPKEDITVANQVDSQFLDSRAQRGSYPNTEYGNLQFALSAVAISKLNDETDMINQPRLTAMQHFDAEVAYMVIQQHIKFDLSVDLGHGKDKKAVTKADLEGNYIIEYEYFSISPEQNISNTAVANAQGTLVSDRYKRRVTLRLENVDDEERQIDQERAEQAIPELALLRWGRAYSAEGKDLEAAFIARHLKVSIQQLTAGQTPAVPEGELPRNDKKGSGGQPLVPLVEAGGAGGRAGPNSQEAG
jgi:hypothetical protein